MFKKHHSWMCACTHVYMPWCLCGGQRMTFRSQSVLFFHCVGHKWKPRHGNTCLYSLALGSHLSFSVYLWTWLILEYRCSLAYNGAVSWQTLKNFKLTKIVQMLHLTDQAPQPNQTDACGVSAVSLWPRVQTCHHCWVLQWSVVMRMLACEKRNSAFEVWLLLNE